MISPRNKTVLKKPALVCLMAFASLDAHALTINVTSWGGNVSAAEQSAFNYAFKEFENLFSNKMTVNIDVQTSSTGLASSASYGLFELPNTQSNYGKLAAAMTGADSAAVLPAFSAMPASTQDFGMTYAEARALGLTASPSVLDGTIFFNAALAYATDANQRQVAGAFDLIGVAEHEISEILGRVPGMDNQPSGPVYLAPLDLFRYAVDPAANQPVFSPTTISGAYFSIDGGKTNLQGFNSQGVSSGADPQDWNGSNPSDPFNAYISPGQAYTLSAVDIATMHALGYTPAAIPLPASIWLFASACLGMGAFGGRRKKPV